jgi:ribosome recycling factor
MVRGMAEEGRVSVRNVRRNEMRDLQDLKKMGEISEDDERRAEAELQQLTGRYTSRIDTLLSEKEAELLEV